MATSAPVRGHPDLGLGEGRSVVDPIPTIAPDGPGGLEPLDGGGVAGQDPAMTWSSRCRLAVATAPPRARVAGQEPDLEAEMPELPDRDRRLGLDRIN